MFDKLVGSQLLKRLFTKSKYFSDDTCKKLSDGIAMSAVSTVIGLRGERDRSLIAMQELKKGQRYGPFIPLASVSKVPIRKGLSDDRKKTRRKMKGSRREMLMKLKAGEVQSVIKKDDPLWSAPPQNECPMCSALSDPECMCNFPPSFRNRIQTELGEEVAKAWIGGNQAFMEIFFKLSLHNKYGPRPVGHETAFSRLTEQLILRLIAEDTVSKGQGFSYFFIDSLMYAAGEAYSEEVFKLQDKALTCIDNSVAAFQVEDTFWSSFSLEEKQILFDSVMRRLHLNTIGSERHIALYSDLSFMNHCCVPSIRFQFDASKAYIIPQRDIKVGEDLTFNYVENREFESFEEMQIFLQHHYGFTCRMDCQCGNKMT